MRWSDIDLHPNANKLRQFAGLWLAFIGSLAVWKGWWQGHVAIGIGLATIALVVGIVGLLWPTRIRLIFVGAMIVAFPIGFVVSHVLLAVLFYGLLTPVALHFRVIDRDGLQLRRRRN